MKTSFFKRESDANDVAQDGPSTQNEQTVETIIDKPSKQFVVRPERSESDYPRREQRERYDDRETGRDKPRRERTEKYLSERADREKKGGRRERPVEVKEAPENVIFGIHPVREAIEAGRPIEKLYIRRMKAGDRGGESLQEIEQIATGASINMQFVPVEKLDRLSRRNNHQGVVATVPPIEYAEIADILDLHPTLILVLDGVTDVRNFGAIARSAECAGVDAIVVGAKNCAPINGEAMKSSAGALSRIPVCRVGSLRNTIKTIQLADIQIVAATEKSDDTIYTVDLKRPSAIIMGSEERGISSDTLKLCDAKASIPLAGSIESLNVSAAAAVLLFEAIRQRS